MNKPLTFFDFIRLAIDHNYMFGVVITSGAQGKIESLGLDAGVGKSTLMCNFLHYVYKHKPHPWEEVKRNLVKYPYEVYDIFRRQNRTPAFGWEDIEVTMGKDKSNTKWAKRFAYDLRKKRPLFGVIFATASDIDELQKDMKKLFHFEVIVAKRGVFEVQRLRKYKDFYHPLDTRMKLRYQEEGPFLPLPREFRRWYENWRKEWALESDDVESEVRAVFNLKEKEKPIELTEDQKSEVERKASEFGRKLVNLRWHPEKLLADDGT